MAKKNFFLEESILDDIAEGMEMVESPISDWSFRSVGWLSILLVIVATTFVFGFNFLNGGAYQSRALSNSGQKNILKAPRGIIYSNQEEALLSNEPSFDIILNLSDLFKDRDKIPEILGKINEIIPFDTSLAEEQIYSVDLEHSNSFPLLKDVSVDKISQIKSLSLSPVIISGNFSRKYQYSKELAHILGYVGLVTEEDIENNSAFSLSDEIGKNGLEAQYDSYIRGENGFEISYKDAYGETIDKKIGKEAVAGSDLYTTIDLELQNNFYNFLSNQLGALGRKSGAGLIMNPQTGEILSLVSLPSFDLGNLKASLFIDESKPTFNRVISGVYSPGSTIKPLVAFGALEEKTVDPLKSIYSKGYIEIPNPYFPDQPSRFVDWKAHGWVNVYSALARSSNVYFYAIGGGFEDFIGLGINKLKEYWENFFLDKKTGIDLPGESSGFLPDPQTKEEKTNQPWRLGDTYNVSIGQGDLMITPIELLRYISAIANKGNAPTPFLVKEIKNSSGQAIYRHEVSYDKMKFKDADNFDTVEDGMINAVTKDYGTANSLNSIPMTIAAKTGSAQIQNNTKVNAFFVGYGPIPSPQIAVLVLIEDAKEGSLNAVPVAKKVFEWYYENRIKNKE